MKYYTNGDIINIQISDFQSSDPRGIHVSTDYLLTEVESGRIILEETDFINLNSKQIFLDDLSLNEDTDHLIQVRYNGNYDNHSVWSQSEVFQKISKEKLVIGVHLKTPGGGSGVWENIDIFGNPITFESPEARKEFFTNHAIYSKIKEVEIDGNHLVYIPKFYYKNIDHRYIWISEFKVDDSFKCHPAFMYHGEELDYYYIAAYHGYNYSRPNSRPTRTTYNNMSSIISNINKTITTGGVYNFHNIYEWSAIQTLFLIEHSTSDLHVLDNGAGPVNYRGIYNIAGSDCSGNGSYSYITCIGCMTASNTALQIWDNKGNRTYKSVGYNMPKFQYQAYYYSAPDICCTRSGEDFDMKDIFFPCSSFSTTTSNVSNKGSYTSLFGSMCYSAILNIYVTSFRGYPTAFFNTGGYWAGSTYTYAYYVTRLSKIDI